jgi:Domain of unknown function (DUF1918)
MQPQVGDEVLVTVPWSGEAPRVGTITGMRTQDGQLRYTIHWLAGDYDARLLPGPAIRIQTLHKAHAGQEPHEHAD